MTVRATLDEGSRNSFFSRRVKTSKEEEGRRGRPGRKNNFKKGEEEILVRKDIGNGNEEEKEDNSHE